MWRNIFTQQYWIIERQSFWNAQQCRDSVVRALEDKYYGLGAILKSNNLIKGKRITTFGTIYIFLLNVFSNMQCSVKMQQCDESFSLSENEREFVAVNVMFFFVKRMNMWWYMYQRKWMKKFHTAVNVKKIFTQQCKIFLRDRVNFFCGTQAFLV